MSKIFKLFLKLAIAAIVLVVVGLTVTGIYLSRNANEYKGYVASIIKDKTGYNLRFEGDFSVSVFPWVGLDTGAFVIENPDEFKADGPNLLSAKSLQIHLRLLSIVSGPIEVKSIAAKDLDVLLIKNKAGNSNWAIKGTSGEELSSQLSANGANSPGNTSGSTSESGAGSAQALFKTLMDSSAKVLKNLSIQSIVLENTSVAYKDEQTMAAYSASKADLEINNIGLNKDVDATISANFKSSAPFLEGSVKGKKVFNIKDATHMSNPVWKVDIDLAKGVLGSRNIQFDGNMSLDGSTLAIGKLHVNTMDGDVSLSGTGDLDKITFNGPLAIKGNPASVISMLMGVSVPKSDVLNEFSLSTDISSSKPKEIALKNIKGALDKSAFNGDLTLNQSGSGVGIFGSLALDSIKLDPYIAAIKGAEPTGKKPVEEAAAASKEGSSAEKPYKAPDASLGLKLAIGHLAVKNLLVDDINMDIQGEKGLYSIKPLTFNFADSHPVAEAHFDLREAIPAFKFGISAPGLNMGMLTTMATGKPSLEGKANVDANLSGRGKGAAGVRKSLAGTVKVNASGKVNELKLPSLNITNIASGSSPTSMVSATLNKFSASFDGAKGVFKNNDMVFDTNVGNGTGSGTVNIAGNTLDYTVIVKSANIEIPVKLYGPLNKPAFRLDAEGMLKNSNNLIEGGKGLIKDEGKSLKKDIKGLGKGLRKLF